MKSLWLPRLNDSFRDALTYWEPRRILYNLVLAGLVLAFWPNEILAGSTQDRLLGTLFLLVLAFIANALYCLAYPVDLTLQLTPLKGYWKRVRWMLFASGVAIASFLAIRLMTWNGMA